MSDTIKAALIIAGGIVAAMAIYMYFSPYQSCVRAHYDKKAGAVYCAQISN